MPYPQTILIVGGGNGIGLEVTKAILATYSGPICIVVFDIEFGKEVGALKAKYPFRLRTVEGDVTTEDGRRSARTACGDHLDTLIYCAGIITPIKRIEDMDMEAVKKTYDVNVFGAMAMAKMSISSLRDSAIRNRCNAGFGKIIILTSVCDDAVTYSGWTPYCTSKAALTRFIQMLAHEEPTLRMQGVYPKLTRTAMPRDVIAQKYKGIMMDHEIERFKTWDEMGEEMVQPPELCGSAVAKLALGLVEGAKSGETRYYDEHVPSRIEGT